MIPNLRWSLVFFILIWATDFGTTQETQITGTNICISKQSCHDCIQTSGCAWCSLPNFEGKRCFLPHVNKKTAAACPDEYINNPDNYMLKVRSKEIFKGSYTIQPGKEEGFIVETGGHQSSSGNFHVEGESGGRIAGSSSNHDAVQLSPQEINLKLRVNQAQKITIKYAQAEDYPVDLYYLMDLSNSMKDDKQKLSDLGQLLVESMSNITSNFRLGFGSFVDKVAMPYVSMVPKALLEPCDGCAAPYGYRNHMPLSQDSYSFASQVRDAPVSGNLDAPEGGFDAVMQAIVCRDEIQWREKARKLLLFSTDAGFHFAGDGKLSGIVKPNDGCCHLRDGMYTHSLEQDYPSIAQINLKAKENSMNIIWAVTEEQIKIYESLTKHIEGSYAAKLSVDSSNIVELVREQYNAISSSVEMKDTASNFVNIKYFSKCLGFGNKMETNKCDGLKVGNEIEFEVEVSVPACPKNPEEWNQVFSIYPIGINESLTVNLEMICNCACEYNTEVGFTPKSPLCDYHGDLSCGICICDDGYFGKNCECNGTGIQIINENNCRPENATNVCNSRGVCECNVCSCDKPNEDGYLIWGQYCECDNFSCDRYNKSLCAGHGNCYCGNCECDVGWTGRACDCSTATTNCVINGAECSGNGKCICNTCVCDKIDGHQYTGKYCQHCTDCPSLCEEIKPCIHCQIYKTNNLTEEECTLTCQKYDIHVVEVAVVEIDDYTVPDTQICHGHDELDCVYTFVYFKNVTTNKIQVNLQRARECPPQVYVMGIVLGVIGAVVIVGIGILLTWKVLTTIHDNREFAKFEKERMKARWDASENPIYRQATSTFKNPTYSASAAAYSASGAQYASGGAAYGGGGASYGGGGAAYGGGGAQYASGGAAYGGSSAAYGGSSAAYGGSGAYGGGQYASSAHVPLTRH